MVTGTFRFDRATHTYHAGQTPVPGITGVIRAAGYSDGEWATAEALARGSAVHAATLAWDLWGDAPSLPESWRGYFSAYLAFRRTVRCEWAELEQPKLSRVHGFAGTPDRVGLLRGRPALLELKTGGPAPWHGVQTAAQDLLLAGRRGLRRRMVVYLAPDGRFALREHTDPGDYLRFLEALSRHGAAAT